MRALYERGLLPLDHCYVAKATMKPEPDGTDTYDVPEAIDIPECARAASILAQGKGERSPVYA